MASCNPVIKNCFFITLIFATNFLHAFDKTEFNVASIAGQDWKLEGIKLTLDELNQKTSQFKLSATKLTLPKPFNDLSLAQIVCDDFNWDHDEVRCRRGRATVKSAYWQSPSTLFSFRLGKRSTTFELQNARLVGSRITLDAAINGENWQAKVQSKKINKDLIDKLFQVTSTHVMQGKPARGSLNLTGTFSGRQGSVSKMSITTDIAGLTDQSQDGTLASENLHLLVELNSKKATDSQWFWQGKSHITGGALYLDPLYLEAGIRPMTLNAQGEWNHKTKRATVRNFTYQHPDVGTLTGNVSALYRDGIKLDKADVVLHSDALQNLATLYINPFFTGSPLSGMTITGKLDAVFSFIQGGLTGVASRFSMLEINDEAGRLAIKNGNGTVNWSSDATQMKQSELAWQQFAINGLPFKSARLRLISQGNRFMLSDKVILPLLGGSVIVDKFSWQGRKDNEPELSFAGSVENVSLEQLTKTLGWTPLSGFIGGQIPGISYRDKILTVKGGLSINVFDGEIEINNLTSAGLFSGLPRLTGDIEIRNLDLDQLTKKFEFGNITGRLSGSINKLELENWRPVTFFAWLETPDNDNSPHTISQKAVNNIASIGGGATNVISRSFLSLFETFRYAKIGMGCYLYQGVCQMMGMEPSGQKYYLIKGGGLPRIDVVGYNSRVNWDVLVERLGRLHAPDNMIVE